MRGKGQRLPAGVVRAESGAFYDDQGLGLGLGSSAAVAAATAGALALAGGLDIEEGELRILLARAAMEGHRAHQRGLGSGADVAASVLGGLLRFDGPRRFARIHWPEALHLRVLRVGPGGCDTCGMVARVRAMPPRTRAMLLQHLADLSERICDALGREALSDLLDGLRDYREGLDRLGEAAHLPICTPLDRKLAQTLRGCRAALKPSGAGRGELAVLLADGAEAMEEALARVRRAGVYPLDLGMDQRGLHRCSDSGSSEA